MYVLTSRQELCHSEFTLNQRSFSDLYIDVVGIYQTEAGIQVGQGEGQPIEYAVKMHQSDLNNTLDEIHNAEGLNHERLEKLCQAVFVLVRSTYVRFTHLPQICLSLGY